MGAPPPAAAETRRNGIAVAALVISIVSLVVALGILLVAVIGGVAAFASVAGEDGYTLLGTAAGATEATPYPGEDLEVELDRVLENDWSTVQSLRCPETALVLADAETVCTGVIDEVDTTVTVTFEDGAGHFTFLQEW